MTPRDNAMRALRVQPLVSQYGRSHLAGEVGDVVVVDLVTDLLHTLDTPESAARVVRQAWAHFAHETDSHSVASLPAFADLVAHVADFHDWLAQVTDEAGDLRPSVALAEYDEARTACWEAISDAAIRLVAEASPGARRR